MYLLVTSSSSIASICLGMHNICEIFASYFQHFFVKRKAQIRQSRCIKAHFRSRCFTGRKSRDHSELDTPCIPFQNYSESFQKINHRIYFLIRFHCKLKNSIFYFNGMCVYNDERLVRLSNRDYVGKSQGESRYGTILGLSGNLTELRSCSKKKRKYQLNHLNEDNLEYMQREQKSSNFLRADFSTLHDLQIPITKQNKHSTHKETRHRACLTVTRKDT